MIQVDPHQEERRLQNLYQYGILDTPDEAAFNQIAEDTSFFLKAPSVMVSFMDRDRQWFKACIGYSKADAPRQATFCQYTLLSDRPMVVENALQHPIFHDHPAVTGAPFIRAYLGVPIISPEGYPLGTVCLVDYEPHSFTEWDIEGLQRMAQRTMMELQQRLLKNEYSQLFTELQTVMQASPGGFVLLDPHGKVQEVNAAARTITQLSWKVGSAFDWKLFTQDLKVSGLEPIYCVPDGQGWFTVQDVRMPDGRTLLVIEDITDHIQNQLYFQTMAFQDVLTGLSNRRAFEEDLRTELAQAERHGHALGVLMMDLDGLKQVNDGLGHEHGDLLLKTFAERLKQHVREGDRCYRLGGDEYAVLLPHTDPQQHQTVLERMEELAQDVRGQGFKQSGVSAGLAFYPSEASTAEALVRLADHRMYLMKQQHHQQQKQQ